MQWNNLTTILHKFVYIETNLTKKLGPILWMLNALKPSVNLTPGPQFTVVKHFKDWLQLYHSDSFPLQGDWVHLKYHVLGTFEWRYMNQQSTPKGRSKTFIVHCYRDIKNSCQHVWKLCQLLFVKFIGFKNMCHLSQ